MPINIHFQKLLPKEDLRQTNKIIYNDFCKTIEQVLEYFPKLDIFNLSDEEIYCNAEKLIQVHSIKCKLCNSNKVCFKVSILINIAEIL